MSWWEDIEKRFCGLSLVLILIRSVSVLASLISQNGSSLLGNVVSLGVLVIVLHLIRKGYHGLLWVLLVNSVRNWFISLGFLRLFDHWSDLTTGIKIQTLFFFFAIHVNLLLLLYMAFSTQMKNFLGQRDEKRKEMRRQRRADWLRRFR